jgi:hypothetical protein
LSILTVPNPVHLHRNFITHINPLTSFKLNHFHCRDVEPIAGPRPFMVITTVGTMQAIVFRRPTNVGEHNLPKSDGFCPVALAFCTLQCCYFNGLLPDILVLCQVSKHSFSPGRFIGKWQWFRFWDFGEAHGPARSNSIQGIIVQFVVYYFFFCE